MTAWNSLWPVYVPSIPSTRLSVSLTSRWGSPESPLRGSIFITIVRVGLIDGTDFTVFEPMEIHWVLAEAKAAGTPLSYVAKMTTDVQIRTRWTRAMYTFTKMKFLIHFLDTSFIIWRANTSRAILIPEILFLTLSRNRRFLFDVLSFDYTEIFRHRSCLSWINWRQCDTDFTGALNGLKQWLWLPIGAGEAQLYYSIRQSFPFKYTNNIYCKVQYHWELIRGSTHACCKILGIYAHGIIEIIFCRYLTYLIQLLSIIRFVCLLGPSGFKLWPVSARMVF